MYTGESVVAIVPSLRLAVTPSSIARPDNRGRLSLRVSRCSSEGRARR